VSVEGSSAHGRIIARIARQVEAALTSVALTLPQYRILGILGDGSAGASALAEKLTVSRPTVTAAVDGLVNRGFVARIPDDRDRRRIHHELTTAGYEALIEADRAVATRLTDIASYLPDGQRPAAFSGLELWRTALDTRRDARIAART
jgi:long-chain acyl-CoA synthetase